MNELDVTLTKAKYRPRNFRLLKRNFDPEGGTKVFNMGRFGAKSSNSGTASKVKTLAPRKKAYGPW